MNIDKISSRQMILLLIMFRLSTVISYMPVIDLPPANQDMWIVILLSFFYSLMFKIPLLFFASRFNNLTFIEYTKKILGKFMGTIIGGLFGLYFIFYSIFLILAQTELVAADILPLVPNWITIGVLMITVIYIGSKGVMAIFWGGEIISPINIMSIIFIIIVGLKNVDFRLLLPILSDSTFYDINLGAIMFPFLLTDIFIFVMNVPHLQNPKDINKIFVKVTAYSLVLITITVVVTQGSLGVEQSKHSNFPFLIYTRLINFRQTLERIDPIYVITWMSVNIIKVLSYIYLSSVTFMEIIGKKGNNIILYIIGILVGLISLYISHRKIIIPLSSTLNNLLITLAVIFITIIPTIILIVYFFRRKSLNKEEQK